MLNDKITIDMYHTELKFARNVLGLYYFDLYKSKKISNTEKKTLSGFMSYITKMIDNKKQDNVKVYQDKETKEYTLKYYNKEKVVLVPSRQEVELVLELMRSHLNEYSVTERDVHKIEGRLINKNVISTLESVIELRN